MLKKNLESRVKNVGWKSEKCEWRRSRRWNKERVGSPWACGGRRKMQWWASGGKTHTGWVKKQPNWGKTHRLGKNMWAGEKSLKLGENTHVVGQKGSDVRCSGEWVQIGENTQGRGNMKWNAVQIRGQGAEPDLSCETLQRKWSALDWWVVALFSALLAARGARSWKVLVDY